MDLEDDTFVSQPHTSQHSDNHSESVIIALILVFENKLLCMRPAPPWSLVPSSRSRASIERLFTILLRAATTSWCLTAGTLGEAMLVTASDCTSKAACAWCRDM